MKNAAKRIKITRKNRPLYIEEIITSCAICGGLFGEDEQTEEICQSCVEEINRPDNTIGYRINEQEV